MIAFGSSGLPKPAEWVEGWGIGTPDMIVELPLPFDVPARGVVDYQHIIVPTNFKEDRWIQAAEVRPTERMVVHHIIAFVREPKSKWFRSQPAGVFFTAPKVSTDEETEAGALPSDFLVGYAPGQPAEILKQALKIDPENPKALELAGAAAFEADDFQLAIKHWQKLLSKTSPDSEIGRALTERIEEAKKRLSQ